MSVSGEISILIMTLFVCVLDGYSMMDYRLPVKHAYGCFAAVTLLCLALNSYIVLKFGADTMHSVIIFTIGIPYFILILLITREKISQTVFNFWLWINVYGVIAYFSAFVNDYTFKNYYFLAFLRVGLLLVYFVIYNRYLRKKHRALMEKLNVNWWIFSFIPMFFTVLNCLVNYYFGKFYGLLYNYPVLLVIHTLMALVYILIFYTFKTVHTSMEKERLAQSMREQIAMQKKQYEFYLRSAETERIFRHDARHRDMILMGYLENEDVSGAKEFLSKEVSEIKANHIMPLCENMLVDTVLSECRKKAEDKEISFEAKVQIPAKLSCDEGEFCVMLSNLLENSLDAAVSYIKIEIKKLNCQLSLNIKNDYSGNVKKDSSGHYVTTKNYGSGLGIKSVNAILKKNSGFMKIDDKNGVFDVFATLRED